MLLVWKGYAYRYSIPLHSMIFSKVPECLRIYLAVCAYLFPHIGAIHRGYLVISLAFYAAGRFPRQSGSVIPADWVVLELFVWDRSVVCVISWEISSTTSEIGMA